MAYEGYGSSGDDDLDRRDRFRRERRSPQRGPGPGSRDGRGDYHDNGDGWSRKRGYDSPEGRDGRKRPRRSATPPYHDDPRGEYGRERYYDDRRRDPFGSRLVDPRRLEHTVSLRYFADYMRQVNPRLADNDAELRAAYGEYKDGAIGRQLLQFFDAHKTEDWFIEKYHPDQVSQRKPTIIEARKKQFPVFLHDLKDGKFDNVDFDSKVEDLETNGDVENGQVPIGGSLLYLKTIPPSLSRLKIEEMLREFGILKKLYLLEPNPTKKYHRTGLAVFDEAVDTRNMVEEVSKKKIDNFSIPVTDQSPHPPRTKYANSAFSDIERLRQDLENVQKLTALFEEELGEGFDGSAEIRQRMTYLNSLADEQDEKRDVKKALDLFITYLRRVFNCCYYDVIVADSQEELLYRCSKHLRHATTPANGTLHGGTKAFRAFDSKLDVLLNRSTVDVAKMGGRPPAVVEIDVTRQQVKQEDGQKFRCNLCGKLFKAEEFVEKHVSNKHGEIIAAAVKEAEFYNNYVLDPSHIIPLPSTQTLGPPPSMMPPRGIAAPPHGYPISGAPIGVPMDQIPRIGFGYGPGPKSAPVPVPSLSAAPPPPPPGGREDPRQMRSYEDLDAPVEGDIELKY